MVSLNKSTSLSSSSHIVRSLSPPLTKAGTSIKYYLLVDSNTVEIGIRDNLTNKNEKTYKNKKKTESNSQLDGNINVSFKPRLRASLPIKNQWS